MGPQQPLNSLRKTIHFTFASFPLSTRLRSPKRLPKSAKNVSQSLPGGAPELPRSPQERPRGPLKHLRSAPGGPLGAKETSQDAFDSSTVSFSSLRDLFSFLFCAFSSASGTSFDCFHTAFETSFLCLCFCLRLATTRFNQSKF